MVLSYPFFLCCCCLQLMKWKKKKDVGDEDGTDRASWNLIFELKTLEAATDNFSDANLLGHGGFGPVYKGMLADGQEIAAKKLSMDSRQGMKEFMNEVRLLLKVQHRNLVTLLGCCGQGSEKALVYEYLPNKSLDNFLFGNLFFLPEIGFASLLPTVQSMPTVKIKF